MLAIRKNLCWPLVLLLHATFIAAQQPTAPAATLPTTLDPATRAEVAQKFAQLLSDEYAYSDIGAKMASHIREQLSIGAYNNLTSPSTFADALQSDARAVSHDLHLRVSFGQQQMPMRQGPSTPESLAQSRRQNGGISGLQILEGNIGYLALDIQVRQDKDATDAIAAAFAFLRNTDALIIDLRGDPGGNGGAELFLSYLSQGAPFLAGTVHWRRDNRVQEFRTTDLGEQSYGSHKPVFMLTSRTTFSAAESLAYEIQSFKRGLIVGETTGGGANPSGGAGLPPLGHGFSVNIPMGYVDNPITHTNWEGVGVKPDVDVPAGDALGKAWSLAAAQLQQATQDPRLQSQLALLASARLAGKPDLSAPQITGTYGSENPNSKLTIGADNGTLYIDQKQPYAARIQLISEGGDRYRPAIFSAGFSLTFALKKGKTILLRADPRGSTVLEKL